ncbi:MAG: hypothetical protein WBI99_06255 [Limnochordia bacterium]|nr:hypothetical protein [Limnochordia bacterium]MDI9465497.1 hypothetical protein [Bacillota bacterium]NLO96134.1 hypothetical protein [Bacillota bacterium]HAI52623.1 hypothetical protein [Bacillota bacterium]HOB41250.1 hypothetical protein [Limnochordia bacterium]
MRKINLLLVVLLVAVLSTTVLAQPKGILVDIPGTGVHFFTYRYEGDAPPYDKVNAIWANLSAVFAAWVEAGQDPAALTAKDVQIRTEDGTVSLYVKDQFIVEVDAYHAALNKATKAQLAEKWAANLRRGIEAFVAINEPLD